MGLCYDHKSVSYSEHAASKNCLSIDAQPTEVQSLNIFFAKKPLIRLNTVIIFFQTFLTHFSSVKTFSFTDTQGNRDFIVTLEELCTVEG